MWLIKRIVFTLILYCLASAQSEAVQKNYVFTTYSQEDGLSSGTIKKIIQDSAGYFWFLSENGLSRFDGYSFKIYSHDPNNSLSIPSSNLLNMWVDEEKHIYLATEKALLLFHPANNSFETIFSTRNQKDILNYLPYKGGFLFVKDNQLGFFNKKNQNIFTYNLPSNLSLSRKKGIRIQNDNIWFSCEDGILCYFDAEKKIRKNPIQQSITVDAPLDFSSLHLFVNNKGEMCFYSNATLYKFNASKKIFQPYLNLKLKESSSNPIKSIQQYDTSSILLRFQYNRIGILNFNTGNLKYIHLNQYPKVSNDSIRIFSLYPSTPTTMWVSTTNAGIYAVETKNLSILEHLFGDEKNKNSLPSNSIEQFFENEGILWMSSPGIGIIKAESEEPVFNSYCPKNQNLSAQSNYNTNIRAIHELDKNTLLIGTLAGLVKFDKSSKQFSNLFSPLNNLPVLPNTAISAICKDMNGTFFISSWFHEGITLLNFTTKRHFVISTADTIIPEYNSIRCMFVDSHNFLWLGTDKNIYRLNCKEIEMGIDKKYVFEKFNMRDSLKFNFTFNIRENNKQQILFGTDNGLYSYDYRTKKFSSPLVEFKKVNSLLHENIRSIFLDNKDHIFIGSNGFGIFESDPNFSKILTINRLNGLSDNYIYTLQIDKKGNLWMGTNRGISVYSTSTKQIRNFSLTDGLQNYEYNTNASFSTSQGELVFGGVSGITIFYPDSVNRKTKKPRIVISEFKVNDREFPLSDSITLEYNQNSISFQFAALSYFRNRYNLYAYKLDGINSDWVYCDTRRFSNYAGLPPGKYTFHVKACNYSGQWNNEGAVIHLTIKPPFWNTWWFKTILLLFLSLIVFFVFRFRLKQKLGLEILRNSIARDLHDEIGSNLTSISIFSAVAQDEDEPEKIKHLINKISEYSQTSQESMNDIVWMINTENDSFEKIILRIRKQAAEIFESTNINLHFNLDEKLNRQNIPMERRKNFYLIYKEALNNILKYADCSNVWIDLKISNSTIELNVTDDGKGFDTSSESLGNGLINMRKRAAELKGQLILNSKLNKGTSIHLKFDI